VRDTKVVDDDATSLLHPSRRHQRRRRRVVAGASAIALNLMPRSSTILNSASIGVLRVWTSLRWSKKGHSGSASSVNLALFIICIDGRRSVAGHKLFALGFGILPLKPQRPHHQHSTLIFCCPLSLPSRWNKCCGWSH
jgi:hypothetical protein